MPLSPEEQQEFASLHEKYGKPAQSSAGLTPEEQAELQQLHAKYGGGQGPVTAQAGAFGHITAPTNLPPGTAEKMQSAAANVLPMAGGILGSAVAGLPGATMGAGVGSELKNLVSGDQASAPEAIGNVVKDAVVQGALPEIGSSVISKLGSFLGKGADWAQQTAMGMKKYSPGAGTEAIEQGVRGTRAGMQKKMVSALQKQGNATDQMIGGLKGSVDSEPVANRVAEYGEKYISPNGHSTDAGFDRANDAFDRASGIANRGEISPEDARSLAQTAEKAEGYSSANLPRANYNSELARQEAQGYRDSLRDLGTAQNVPIAEQFKSLHNLLKGQKALNTPQALNWNSPITSLTKAAFKETIARPEVMSYEAALGNLGSKAATSPIGQQSPRGLQLLLQRPENE